MRALFWLLLLLVSQELSAGYALAFVHIGDQLPAYLTDAVLQARLFHEEADIYLVANQRAWQKAHTFPKQQVQFVACEELASSQEHQLFLACSPVNRSTWNGLWLYSVERFFYLQELVKSRSLENLFHLEGDNLLYVDLATLLPIFEEHYPGLGVTFDSNARVVPGFVFIRDLDAITAFVRFVAERAGEGLMDMTLFPLFGRWTMRRGSGKIDPLPIIPSNYASSWPLISPNGLMGAPPQRYSNHFDLFGSVFDAAALGQYLGGIDPGHSGYSTPGFINESCVFNPSLFDFSWELDHKGRKVLWAEFEGVRFRVNNLHVHCKDLQKFSSCAPSA